MWHTPCNVMVLILLQTCTFERVTMWNSFQSIQIKQPWYVIIAPRTAKILACLFTAVLAGCSTLQQPHDQGCNSHAYVNAILADYISRQYHRHTPPRMAIIPFSVPANVAYKNIELPGMGHKLAQRLHAYMLQSEVVPVVELVNRADWPGKKEEFFTGNFGALSQARAAGYDLVLVGYLEPRHGLTSLSAYSKLIDVNSGITVWYGKTEVHETAGLYEQSKSWLGLKKRRPAEIPTAMLVNDLASCITIDIVSDEIVQNAQLGYNF